MSELVLEMPGTIQFGADAVTHIGVLASRLGSRCLVVTESVMHDGRHIDRVRGLLAKRGVDCIVYDELPPGSTTTAITEVANIARAGHVQMVVGLGGMRVLSTARCAAVVAGAGVSVAELIESRDNDNLRAIPYIEVPSSCRNHFMLKNQCIVTVEATRDARLVYLPVGLTRAVVVDPKLTLTQSAKYNAAAMLDTLLAATESYLSNRATFFSDPAALQAIEILGGSIVTAFRNPSDIRPRVRASEAGLLCAFSLATSSQGVGGAIAYTINSRHNIPKSWLATVMLPHVLDRFVDAQPEKLAAVAQALGEDIEGLPPTEAAERAPSAVRRFLGQVGLPTRLRDFDLSLDEMVEAGEHAHRMDCIHTSSVPLSIQDLYELTKAAF